MTVVRKIFSHFVSRTLPVGKTTPLVECQTRLFNILKGNIAPFWLARSLDDHNGGYQECFGPRGETLEQTTKTLVAQARMLFFWSRLARSPYLTEHRDIIWKLTESGHRFLVDKMWDEEFGGFYRKVSVDGLQVIDPSKSIYAHAFAILAIAEYCRLTDDAEAISFLAREFNIIDAASHDELNGGYRDHFDQEWQVTEGDIKSANTHLHMLEALTSLVGVVHTDIVRHRLTELLFIQCSVAVSRSTPTLIERQGPAWTPLIGEYDNRVSFGHDIENAWLVIDACKALELPIGLVVGFSVDAFRVAATCGYDHRYGGFYFTGKASRRSMNTSKIWWVQAEALVATLRLFTITGDSRYFDYFVGTLDFVEKYLVDWQNGEWRPVVAANGTPFKKKIDFIRPEKNKGDEWKQAYHTGRAVIECLDMMDLLDVGEINKTS